MFIIFSLALFWVPLPFGSNRSWAVAVLAVVFSALLILWLGLYLFDQVAVSRSVWRRGKWPTLILGCVTFWVFVQTLPLPMAAVQLLSPRAAELHVAAERAPLSLDLAATRVYLLNSLACFAAFFLVLVLVNSEKRVKALLWVLVVSGTFQAVFGALMVLTGLEWGFMVKKYTGLGRATGTYVNVNHLAGYLVMSLSVGTGLLISQLSSKSIDSWRALVLSGLRLLLSPKIFLRLFLALMVVALVMTRSRMGNSAFFVALAVAGVVAVLAGRKFSPKLALLLLSLLIVDTWIVGQWFGLEKVVERLEQTNPSEEGRLTVSADSASILDDFAITGSGGGSFYSVFSYYQGVESRGKYDHAHNDYLEIASDMGVPTLILLGIFYVLVCIRAVQLQRRDHSRLQRGVGFALVMVLTWLAMHSAVDFNLQIPANSVTLCAILGLAFARLLHESKVTDSLSIR